MPRLLSLPMTCLLLASSLAVGACGSGDDGGGERRAGDAKRDADKATGVVVVHDLDERGQRYVEGSRTYLRIDGSTLWSKPRTQDGTVRLDLPVGKHELTAYQYVCTTACPDDERIRTLVSKDEDGDATLATCSTTVDVEADGEIWMRATTGSKLGTCSWKEQASSAYLQPPDRPMNAQAPPPTWIESSYGSLWMDAGSSCWRFTEPGAKIGGTACGDSVAPSCRQEGFRPPAPTLDVRPGEQVRIHVGVVTKSVGADLQPHDVAGEDIKLDLDQPGGPRTFSFPAPDADALLNFSLRAERGSGSFAACLHTTGTADSDEPATIVTARSKHIITTEERARRKVDSTMRGSGGNVPIPGTLECAKVDRDDDIGFAWKCTTFAGEVHDGKVQRRTLLVQRDDVGRLSDEREFVDAPDELLVVTPASSESPGIATIEGSAGAVDMQLGSYCWISGCTDSAPPPSCEADGSPPHLRAFEGDIFSVVLPFDPTSAYSDVDEGNVHDQARAHLRGNVRGRFLHIMLLKPDRPYVSVVAKGQHGDATWYACLDVVRDHGG